MFKKHVVAWFFGTLMLLIGNIVFDDRSVIEQFTSERQMIVSSMGDGAAGRIQSGTNSVYTFCCNWLADLTHRLFVPPTDDDMGVRDHIEESHQGFWTSIYMSITRSFVVLEWGVVFWVLILAAFGQGLTKRSIRKTNMDWTSPVKYHLALHYVVGIAGLFINYLLWPWSVHPYFPAALMLLMTYTVYMISSNIQPKV